MKTTSGRLWIWFWLGWSLALTNTGGAATNAPAGGPANFVWMPPGVFLLGSPETEKDREANEGPQTDVIFTRGFRLKPELLSFALRTGRGWFGVPASAGGKFGVAGVGRKGACCPARFFERPS